MARIYYITTETADDLRAAGAALGFKRLAPPDIVAPGVEQFTLPPFVEVAFQRIVDRFGTADEAVADILESRGLRQTSQLI